MHRSWKIHFKLTFPLLICVTIDSWYYCALFCPSSNLFYEKAEKLSTTLVGFRRKIVNIVWTTNCVTRVHPQLHKHCEEKPPKPQQVIFKHPLDHESLMIALSDVGGISTRKLGEKSLLVNMHHHHHDATCNRKILVKHIAPKLNGQTTRQLQWPRAGTVGCVVAAVDHMMGWARKLGGTGWTTVESLIVELTLNSI